MLSAVVALSSVRAGAADVEWPSVTSENKPWTRLWWLGNIGTDQDFTSEMEKYSKAGLGGVELTPIYGVKGQEDKFVPYLSPAWVQRFEHILKEGKRLDLGIDMATGNGWPFGGPWVTPEIASKDLAFKTFLVQGGAKLTQPVIFMQEPMLRALGPAQADISQLKEPTGTNPNLQQLAPEQVRHPKRLPLQLVMAYPTGGGQPVDLTSKVAADGTLDWTAPPGGAWSLYAILIGDHGKQVERAGPGGEGEVIDHFDADALKVHLAQFEKAFAGKQLKLRAYFNDSYEVDDATGESNWTPKVFEQFQKRRGYDLRLHLNELLSNQNTDSVQRVKSDFRETMSDLLVEEYTDHWAQWAKDRGALIRNQAHGSPANIFDLYAASGIAETEGADPLRSKFVASASHVTGHPLTSSESATWLEGHFITKLSSVKTAVDNFMLGGVNHIFYHGTAFSPPGEPWPGFLFYASTNFQPTNSWWTDFSALNQYVTRAQSFLQGGKPDEDVLIYHSLYDSWAQGTQGARGGGGGARAGRGARGARGATTGPANETARRGGAAVEPSMAPPPEAAVAADGSSGQGVGMLPHFSGPAGAAATVGQTLYRAGHTYDFISDRYLAKVAFSDGALRTGGVSYRAVVVPQIQFISVETFEKLTTLAQFGATILVQGRLPADVPGLGNLDARRQKFKELSAKLSFTPSDADGIQTATLGSGRFLMGENLDALMTRAGAKAETMVSQNLSFIRRAYPDGYAYFIVNQGTSPIDGYVSLQRGGASVAIFDPLTGDKGLAWTRSRTGGAPFEAMVQLAPGDSCILRTYNTPAQGAGYSYWTASEQATPVTGNWSVKFTTGGPQLPAAAQMTELKSWTDLSDAAKIFSGTATYSLNFIKPAVDAAAWRLDLGTVHESARVSLNGKEIATLIKAPYHVTILPEMLRAGENSLEVSVSNLMANRVIDMDNKGIEFRRFYNANMQRMPSWKGSTPLPSGLIGPVRLRPLAKRAMER